MISMNQFNNNICVYSELNLFLGNKKNMKNQKKLSLDIFKEKYNDEKISLAKISGGILGSCHPLGGGSRHTKDWIGLRCVGK
jgi:hypothetical protein